MSRAKEPLTLMQVKAAARCPRVLDRRASWPWITVRYSYGFVRALTWASLAGMKRLDKGISTSLKDNHKELSRQQDAVTRVAGEFLDRIAEEYIRDITTQTRGSHRIKRANRHGSRAVARLKILVGTGAEHAIIGYLERARLRAELADKYQRRIASRDERSSLILFVLERLVLEDILELDKMGALGAIQRVRRCIHCMSWVWCRVKNQRYC